MPSRRLLHFTSPISTSLLALWFIITCPWLSVAVDNHSSCYDLAKNKLDVVYAPCDTTEGATASACCAVKNFQAPDICTTSGLCMTTGKALYGQLYAVGCTDPNGKAKGCPTICDNVRTDEWTHAHVYMCTDGHWCCRQQNILDSKSEIDCCDNENSTVSVDDITTKVPENQGLSDNESSTTNGLGSQGSGSIQSSSSGSHGRKINMVAIVAGVLGGVLVLVVVIFLVLYLRSRWSLQPKTARRGPLVEADQEAIAEAPGSSKKRVEIDGAARSELPTPSIT